MKLKLPISIRGEGLKLEDVDALAKGAPVALDPSVKQRVVQSFEFVQKLAHGEQPVYGVNTGFGYFANTRIERDDRKALQVNILRSHASGYGNPLSPGESRVAVALRLNALVKGCTGVSWELCEKLSELIRKEIYPVIPEYGSVGASGDLAPLAHLALPLIGEGKVHYRGEIVSAAKAFKEAGVEPIELKEKEGLGLINGTQIMLAVGAPALYEAIGLLHKANRLTALTYEAMQASLTPLNRLIHAARGHLGQMEAAEEILGQLEGSYLHESRPLRVQDPYSLRCAPQVHGASADVFSHCRRVVEIELNGATDNPLAFSEEGLILSGGNFHGQPLALAFDMAAMALSELSNISERRLELLLNPHSSGLPAFLTPEEGLCSGYMAAQYLSASLVNENKGLANPASTDSIPGNVGVEDHVSMGMTSARKLKRIVHNSYVVLAIELLAAAQAIDLRKVAPLAKKSGALYAALRGSVPMLIEDRIVSEDVEKAVSLLRAL